ncbi:hypothetical protein [Marinobacter sp. KMM 10035]|uniref:hypothetical protein n=1 Tax=Marinobacter sp. KMM 10035 TaxID=3134034 RepID=UPI00397E82B4
MITDEIRAEKKEEMDELFWLTCDLWSAREYKESERIGAKLHGFRDAFLGLDGYLFSYGLQLTSLFNLFLVSDAETFEAFAMLKACQAFKGLNVDPAPAPVQSRVGSADVDYGPLDPSIAAENNRLATDYMADRPRLRGGVVIVFKGQCSGWMNELRNPERWEPGCFAIDSRGNQYLAIGGDSQNGATSWNLVYHAPQLGEAA